MFIGYGKAPQDAKAKGEQLLQLYRQSQFEQLPQGETVVHVSWEKALTGPEHYFAWLLKGNDGGWDRLDPHAFSPAAIG